MPSSSATRRASCASSTLQHPRAPLRSVWRSGDSARWTPVTSCPASTASAAATAESTPPLIAAMTLTATPLLLGSALAPLLARWRSLRCSLAVASPRRAPRPTGALHDGRDDLEHRVDVGVGGRVAEAEAQRAARAGRVGTRGEQHVAGPGHPGAAGRPGRALDA